MYETKRQSIEISGKNILNNSKANLNSLKTKLSKLRLNSDNNIKNSPVSSLPEPSHEIETDEEQLVRLQAALREQDFMQDKKKNQLKKPLPPLPSKVEKISV